MSIVEHMKKPPDDKNILQQIHQLNQLIEKFIHSALEQIDEGEDLQTYLFANEAALSKQKCWEIKDCRQMDCPCRMDEDYRCWLVMGSMRQGCCRGFYAQEYGTCYECEVFKQYNDSPVSMLYENINILISNLVEKIKKERELAIKDGLTGLYNRNFLKMIMKRDILDLNSKSFPLSVIVFDLDKLKMINDTYGHIAGDKMIKELSAFLSRYKREPDLLFRMGGDEFMLMMSGVDEKRRTAAEARLAKHLTKWNQKRKGLLPVPLSFSLGGATGFWGKDLDQIILEADEKMYALKQSKQETAILSASPMINHG